MKQALVRYLDQTAPIDCPYGQVRRVVTAGAGGVANVHVVEVTEGSPHFHEGYDEVYYVLDGTGELTVETERFDLRPGAVAVIPAGKVHALKATADGPLRFIIFGVPPVAVDSNAAKPRKPLSQVD